MSHAFQEKADLFLGMHRRGRFFVLPNAWDVVSAQLLAQLPGVQALATSSAAIAAHRGLPDGERLPRAAMLSAVHGIAEATPLPVTADLEAGYATTPSEMRRTVEAALHAGVVGINIEDGVPGGGLDDARRHAEKVTVAKEVAQSHGVSLVVNARTDTYWRGVGTAEWRREETWQRARIYREAGADCVFVPGFPEPATPPEEAVRLVRDLVDELDGTALNLLAGAGVPAVADLADIGGIRLSVGSLLYRIAMHAVRDRMAAFLADGRPDTLVSAAGLSYPELAALLSAGDGTRGTA